MPGPFAKLTSLYAAPDGVEGPRRSPPPAALPARIPGRLPGAAEAAPHAARRPRDVAAIDPGASAIKTGGKRELAAYTPDEAEPARAFTLADVPDDESLHRPDFAIALQRKDGTVSGLSVRLNAAGETLTVHPDGTLELDGRPLAISPEHALCLPGGGKVTDWGMGYVALESAAGDHVSVFARGASVDGFGQLASGGTRET